MPGFLLTGNQYRVISPIASAVVVNPQDVNNRGIVAGFFSTDGEHQHGFFYNSNSGAYTLAADPVIPNLFLTQFLGINDDGQAVGYYQTNDGSQHGFIYNISQQTYTFLDEPRAALSGFSVTQITGINDSGEISGFYVDSTTGLQRGFTAVIPTPEPASMLLALIAVPVFLVRRVLMRVLAQHRS